MPLNYSKWDALEVSDDSDIEGHPNVDHKSLVRWKQRQIHEDREARKHKIATLKADIQSNPIIQERLREVRNSVKEKGVAFFSAIVERLEKQPSPERPPAPLEGTYDGMLLSLLRRTADDVKELGIASGDPRLDEELIKSLDEHLERMPEFMEKAKKELEYEEAEQKKKITSEDIRPGFSSTVGSSYIPSKPEPAPLPGALGTSTTHKKKATTTTVEYEVLNPKSVASSSTAPPPDLNEDDEIQEDEADIVPEVTPVIAEFSKLPLGGFQASWDFIRAHRDVVVPGASDALLVAGYRAEREGKHEYAKRCVHQSLLLQYGEKLGRDGISVFFGKMIDADPRAVMVFMKDVDDTYNHIVTRVKVNKEEEEAFSKGTEQIQLVPENPGAEISFNVPDGPPPENIKLEGPGTEGMEIEEVRKALQMQWEVFESFEEDMKAALKSQKLDSVNKVLGSMKIEDAERVVELLQISGMLSFSENGIRDQTGELADDVD
ncbi:hypothetical protein BDM02DRAFT_3268763 [Thelephora ganbajun]|uniref:Uncharacterized protein n=1 Tax=Thelephora ganbajun TaxID=370292 RepID=A0ACB6ZIN2_THEGA|nr:hypothetical protein BDM02DRAFT_3268763 [Thelephora ganbajun]